MQCSGLAGGTRETSTSSSPGPERQNHDKEDAVQQEGFKLNLRKNLLPMGIVKVRKDLLREVALMHLKASGLLSLEAGLAS